MPLDWSPLWLSLRYAGLATMLATLLALPLAWLLAHRRFPGCELLDAAASLPLVFPPAVHAAVAVSAIYTLPLLVRMTRTGLEAMDHSVENAARSLGAGEWRIFWRVTLPLAWRALVAAVLAGFVRALADFGATVVVSSGAATAWLLPLAAVALAALYIGNRVRRAQVLA